MSAKPANGLSQTVRQIDPEQHQQMEAVKVSADLTSGALHQQRYGDQTANTGIEDRVIARRRYCLEQVKLNA